MNRRQFLQVAAGATAAVCCGAPAESRPARIIDTHVHFYDPSRPQGVPWPPKNDALLYRTVLPEDYRALPVPQRVDGVVVVEASPWVEDNQWILDIAAQDKLIVGLVGNLPLGTPEFAAHLKRFAANPRFVGIRSRTASLEDAVVIKDLEALAERGLSYDVPSPIKWVAQAVRLAQRVPKLRLIINHVASVTVNGQQPPQDWQELMRRLAANPQVFMKISGLVEGTQRRGGDAPADVEFYRPVLEFLWKTFGADRLIYGSNWPVSERFAPLARVQQIPMTFFAGKSRAALDKVFWENALVAYRLRGGAS